MTRPDPKPIRHFAPVHPREAVRHLPLDDSTRILVTVVLNPGSGPPAPSPHPSSQTPADRDAIEDLLDPGEDAFKLLRVFAAEHGLDVVEESRARHDVVLSGSATQLEKAFRVELHHYDHDDGAYYGHSEEVTIPDEMRGVVTAVLGLDSIPRHRPMANGVRAVARWSAPELAEHYAFPEVDTSHLRIALIQFGGGFHSEDVQAYAGALGISAPPITVIPVEGSDGESRGNSPVDMDLLRAVVPEWAASTSFMKFAEFCKEKNVDLGELMTTLEVTMDVELAVALGGGAAIDVYVAPHGVDGWRRAFYAALGLLDLGTTPYPGLPTVVSVSWGDDEQKFSPSQAGAINSAIQTAARMGVTVCCSSGDRGTVNGHTCDYINVNFPSSSPWVLSCGGTALLDNPGGDPNEQAWNGLMMDYPMASGGGVSGFFAQPGYQVGLATPDPLETQLHEGVDRASPGRWLPDVAASAAFEAGVKLVLGGSEVAGGGTSASTPTWASLLTRVAAELGHSVGFLNKWLYAVGTGGPCRDMSGSDNDVCGKSSSSYRTAPGWDACTGWGAPDGAALVEALRASAPGKS